MNIAHWGFEINKEDHLVIGGCDSIKLAEEFGTPLHVIDKTKLLADYNRFKEAFRKPGLNAEVFYSYKTNCLPGMLQMLHKNGAGAEVISHYELWLAIKLGVNPDKIVFNGPNKSLDSLRLAVQHGIRLINIDSVNEISKIKKVADELGKRVNVGIRIKPPVGWQAQFGFDMVNDEALLAYGQLNKNACFDVKGMHAHIGTGIKKPQSYAKTVETMLTFAKVLKDRLNIDIKHLDIGGGFCAPTVRNFGKIGSKLYSFFNNVPQVLLNKGNKSIETFAEEIADSVRKNCERLNLREPDVFLEPGRAITSSAQVLLVTVGVLKKGSSGKKIAITDGGKTTIAYPISFEYHEAFVANRMSKERTEKIRITGNLCTPADIIFRNKKLPELQEGDRLAIMDAGAYFMSFSNNFAFPRPPVVIVSDAKSTLTREREPFEHLVALDKNITQDKK